MSIKFTCPHCTKALYVKDPLAGKKVQCPRCKKAIVVPVPVAQPAIDAEAIAAAAFADGDKPVVQESAKVEFLCPMCDEKIALNVELAGKQAPCPSCRRIIRVPALEKKQPLDWRKIDTSKPIGALRDDLKAPEGAWGAQSAGIVSREALVEAKAIAEERPKLTWQQWLRRGTLAFACLGIVAFGTWLTFYLTSQNRQSRALDKALSFTRIPHWDPNAAAEIHRLAGEYELAANNLEGAPHHDGARQHFDQARNLVSQEGEAQSTEPDLVLIDLALSQIGLGGDKAQVDAHLRLKWDDVRTPLRQTLQKLSSPDGKVTAIREVARKLVAIDQGKLAAYLAGLFGEERAELEALVGLELLRAKRNTDAESLAETATKSRQAMPKPPVNPLVAPAQLAPKPGPAPAPTLVALWIGLGKLDRARALAPEQGAPAEIAAQFEMGQAWGLGLKGEWSQAQAVARAIPNVGMRLTACAAIAEAALDAGQRDAAKSSLEEAAKLLEAEKGKEVSPWLLRRLAGLAWKAGFSDVASAIVRLIGDPALRGRAWLEQTQLSRSPEEIGAKLGPEVDKNSTAYALAMMEGARYLAGKGESAALEKGIAGWEPEKLRPFGYLGLALGLQEHNQ